MTILFLCFHLVSKWTRDELFGRKKKKHFISSPRLHENREIKDRIGSNTYDGGRGHSSNKRRRK